MKPKPIEYTYIKQVIKPGQGAPGGTWCSFCKTELCRTLHEGTTKERVLSAKEWAKEKIMLESNNLEVKNMDKFMLIAYRAGLEKAQKIYNEAFGGKE